MFSLRTHVLILLSIFAMLLIVGWGGAILQGTGVIRDLGGMRVPMIILMGVLVLGLAFSAIPVMVMLVLGFQKHVGNENVAAAAVAVAMRLQNTIIYAMWVLMALGTAIAIPAAIRFGAFDVGPAANDAGPSRSIGTGASQGMLVAKPGMTLMEMRQASSLPIDLAEKRTSTGALANDIVFDFTVAGTAIRFERCRYYLISTATEDPGRIESMSIGTSSSKVTRAALEEANSGLRGALAADGWLAGHEEYKTSEDQSLHGGATRGPEGDLWLKQGTVLHIEGKRVDDAVAGENPDSAGEWIQTVSLWGHDDYPWIERYAFGLPGA